MSARKSNLHRLREFASAGKSLTTAEAAKLTGYTMDHIALMIRKGVVKGSKRGRDWFANANSLLDYVLTLPRPGRKRIN